jgi:phosphate uptake regulator
MTTLSQRVVNDAIKAYALNSLELCHKVRDSGQELRDIQVGISNRGRRLLEAALPVDSTSMAACCSLRIYAALQLTHTAAIEMAQNTRLKLEHESLPGSTATVHLSMFVNSLVRLCSVALLKEEPDHARTVLEVEGGRRKCDLWLYRAHEDLMQRAGAPSRRELAISRCLGQIAEQSYELAEAVILWLETRNGAGTNVAAAV